MNYKSQQGGAWKQGTPKKRENGQWVEIGTSDDSGDGTESHNGDGGFSWDQTFTDTSWLYDADANENLNVEKVTTLDYNAPGGLEEAVNNADSYPTVVVFEVGGVIKLSSSDNFHLYNDQVWVAGETAPWPGISIVRGRCRAYANEVIISHIGMFPGDETDEDMGAINHDGDDVLVDHCTAAFSTRTNVGAPNEVHRCSCINTIIAEGLYDNPNHSEYRARGFLVNDENCSDWTVSGCLFAHNNRRHPMTRSDMVMVNNYTYNFADMSENGGSIITLNSPGEPDITAKGLRFDPGTDTSSDYDREIFNYSANLYVDDIVYDDQNRALTDGSQDMVENPPLVPDGFDLDTDVVQAADTREYVTTNVGPRPADRAPYEQELINNRLEEPHGVIDSQNDVGGYPDYTQTNHTLNVPSSDVIDWVKSFTNEVESET